MTVSGILSGLINPLGTGYVLSRAAARFEPISPAEPVRGKPRPEDRPPGIDEGESRDAPHFDTQDVVELSPAARRSATRPAFEASTRDTSRDSTRATGNRKLTDEEQARVDDLKKLDTEVRQHEAAHLSAAGPYALGGASFEYETGPDDKPYAVSGEVQIDTTPVPGDPEATISKMETVRAAALAPAKPSAQDRAVAARAAQLIQAARAEQAKQQGQEGEMRTGEAGYGRLTSSEPATPHFVDTYA